MKAAAIGYEAIANIIVKKIGSYISDLYGYIFVIKMYPITQHKVTMKALPSPMKNFVVLWLIANWPAHLTIR
jgi:hypothetical protein